jgi:hypothetical protein
MNDKKGHVRHLRCLARKKQNALSRTIKNWLHQFWRPQMIWHFSQMRRSWSSRKALWNDLNRQPDAFLQDEIGDARSHPQANVSEFLAGNLVGFPNARQRGGMTSSIVPVMRSITIYIPGWTKGVGRQKSSPELIGLPSNQWRFLRCFQWSPQLASAIIQRQDIFCESRLIKPWHSIKMPRTLHRFKLTEMMFLIGNGWNALLWSDRNDPPETITVNFETVSE